MHYSNQWFTTLSSIRATSKANENTDCWAPPSGLQLSTGMGLGICISKEFSCAADAAIPKLQYENPDSNTSPCPLPCG